MADPRCRFCDAVLTDILVDLGLSPLANDYVPRARHGASERFYPLCVYRCSACDLVQLPAVEIPPEDIFGDYAYFSSYAESWLRHAEAYAETMTARLDLDASSRVVEIASNDGYLLQYFVARGIPVLGVEPARNVAEVAIEKGVPTRCAFFGRELAEAMVAEGQQADLLVANNVLAHTPHLNDFVAGLRTVLAPGGLLTVEFPHLVRMIEENQFDTIYHEHFSYFRFGVVCRLFASHGLTVVDVDELPTHGGSLRVHARRDDDPRASAPAPAVAALRQRERDAGYDTDAPYDRFAARVHATKRALLRFLLDEAEAGRTVVGYGAPAKGNTLLNFCGVRSDLLRFTVDRSPHKQGHLLPGTRIPIHAPDAIREARPDRVLILPWNLRDEIMDQMADIAAWGGRFVVAIPELTVLDPPDASAGD
ncbi:MAG: class I SAM-dependent methyltransferase [Acidobacteriota bacterium]